VSIVLKSRSLILLEPAGTVQACNGIALPLSFTFLYMLGCVEAEYTVDVSEENSAFMFTLLEVKITLTRDSFEAFDYT